MIIHESNGNKLYIPENKIIWARAKDGVFEVAIAEVHGLTNCWSWATTNADEILHLIEEVNCDIEFWEGK